MSIETLETLLALPQAKYSDDLSKIDPAKVIAADMHAMIVTNPSSIKPIACTGELVDCLGIIAINTSNQAMAVAHARVYDGQALIQAVDAVRRNPADMVDIYCIGASKISLYEGEWEERINSVVTALNEIPNKSIKAFDVGDKPHPTGFAVKWDNDNYRLIRLSGFTSPGEKYGPLDDYRGGMYTITIDGKEYGIETPATVKGHDTGAYVPTFEAPTVKTWDGREPENQVVTGGVRIKQDRSSTDKPPHVRPH